MTSLGQTSAYDLDLLLDLQRETFDYFINECDPKTGLVADSNQGQSPASVAVVGMGLVCDIVAVDRHLLPREKVRIRALRVLRFFRDSKQGTGTDASGYKGFYFHFLDLKTGLRAWNSELSTIDTALLIAGSLTCAQFFDGADPEETEIRECANFLYRRVDWLWAMNGQEFISHGWTPEKGFLNSHWDRGYSEAMILYILALASPNFPLDPAVFMAWTRTFEVKTFYNQTYIYAAPLFIHQFCHMWIDFREIFDQRNVELGWSYFENSRRAVLAQRAYAIENPLGFKNYDANHWGLTASEGPGNTTVMAEGRERKFCGYAAREAPDGFDDGTLAPWAVVAALPFAPQIVMEAIRSNNPSLNLKNNRLYGLDASYNQTFPCGMPRRFEGESNWQEEKNQRLRGWISIYHFGLGQAQVVIMIENFLSARVWNLTKRCPVFTTGLRRAGFQGGWLKTTPLSLSPKV